MNKIKIFNKGFTLLELLIVVLIIGILAAVALPQYQLAVDKAQFAKMQMKVSPVRKAYLAYMLRHKKGPKSFKSLNLDVPNADKEYRVAGYFTCITLPDMYLCMSEGGSGYGGNVRAFKKDLSVIYTETLLTSKSLKKVFSKHCNALKNDDRANRLCRNIGSNKKNTVSSTPLSGGIRKEYYQYDLN